MAQVIKELDNGDYSLALIKSSGDSELFSVRLYSRVTMRHVFWTKEMDKKTANRTYRQFRNVAS